MKMKQKPSQPEPAPDVQPAPEAQPAPSDKSDKSDKSGSPADTPASTPDIDIDALIAEAEQRGYIRGCNERIANLMEQPGPWQSQPPATQDDNDEILILNNLRPSVWDK